MIIYSDLHDSIPANGTCPWVNQGWPSCRTSLMITHVCFMCHIEPITRVTRKYLVHIHVNSGNPSWNCIKLSFRIRVCSVLVVYMICQCQVYRYNVNGCKNVPIVMYDLFLARVTLTLLRSIVTSVIFFFLKGSVIYLWLVKLLASEIRYYICNVSSHLLRPCSAIDRKRALVLRRPTRSHGSV